MFSHTIQNATVDSIQQPRRRIPPRYAIAAPLVTAAPWDHAVAVATGVSASSRVSRCRSAVAGGKDTLSMASSTPVPFPTQVASSTVASRPAVRFGVATGATAAARSAATAAASASPLGDTTPCEA
ncbi:hypothetical protein Vretifemale_17102 [Volvox reticuliferus]|nr:hypothetical protein Vretifemale_17102 [Volvox reticuliferus]